MNVTYAKAVSWAVPFFLALIALEFTVDRIKGTRYYCLADSINSLSCGVVSTGMRVFFGFIGLFVYEWLYVHVAPIHLPDSLTVYVFAFVLYDLCYYWDHRCGHTMNLFWASHVVHHQSEEFNLTTALRQSGTDSFIAWIFFSPMAICGISMKVYLLVAVAQLFYQFWPHTQVIGKMGILDRLIQTPSNHRVHHAQNDAYLDKNYVGVFMLWDHMFGSYQEELADDPCIFGIRGQLNSWNPVWANLHYYWALAKDSWRARSWSDKLRVWYMNPGWRPPELAASDTKKSWDPKVDFVKYDPPRNAALSIYGLVQFIVLVAANSHFLAILPRQALGWNMLYFLLIAASLLCLGGVLENRREFLYAEAARLTLISLAVAASGTWFGGIHALRVLVPLVAFQFVSLGWLWLATREREKQQAEALAA